MLFITFERNFHIAWSQFSGSGFPLYSLIARDVPRSSCFEISKKHSHKSCRETMLKQRHRACPTNQNLVLSSQLPEKAQEEAVTTTRRAVLAAAPAALLASTFVSVTNLAVVSPASALLMAEGKKVVVLGGTGFVGSRVVEALVARGCSVTSVSKSGKAPNIVGADKVAWTAADALVADLSNTFSGAEVVISCIGVIGGSDAYMEKGNGEVNVRAINQAKAAGVPKFVYVSVASIVPSAVDGIALKGYFAGKRKTEAALEAAYPGEKSAVIAPSFIYGGNSFELSPPRVPAGYGGFIENTLGSGLVKGVAGIMPGPIALTLAPPVSVEKVALGVVAGALGVASGKIDGTAAINSAAKLV